MISSVESFILYIFGANAWNSIILSYSLLNYPNSLPQLNDINDLAIVSIVPQYINESVSIYNNLNYGAWYFAIYKRNSILFLACAVIWDAIWTNLGFDVIGNPYKYLIILQDILTIFDAGNS